MPVYRLVLSKLKKDATAERVNEYRTLAKSLSGKIPGLRSFEVNTPLPATAERTKGYDLGIVVIVEKEADLKTYAEHPAHLEARKLRLELVDDTIAFDLEFED